MNFNLLCDASREAGVLKLSKNAKFQVFVDVCILFSNFLVRLRSGLGFLKNHKGVTFSFVPNCFYFALYSRLARESVQNYEK